MKNTGIARAGSKSRAEPRPRQRLRQTLHPPQALHTPPRLRPVLPMLPRFLLLAALAPAFTSALTGCLVTSELVAGSGTEVQLTQGNYRYVHQNLRGTDTGFWFLGVIPFVSPSVNHAMDDIVVQAQLMQPSASRALVHLAQERSWNYFILFALPQIAVRADVVEFTR
jgi:hypothetical protein